MAKRPGAVEPRKRPRQHRSAATVEAILEAAARILEAEGAISYTTNEVARLAGVSVGSLYQYFPHRDAITAAVVERETATLLADVAEARRRPGCAARLAGLIEAAVRYQLRRPALARVLDEEERRLPLGGRESAVRETIAGAIREALAAPGAPPPGPDAAVAPDDLLALVRALVDAAGERRETDAPALTRRVARAVDGYLGWSGLGAAP